MKALLLLHLASAVLLVGASGHAAIAAVLVKLGRTEKMRFFRTYARLTAVLHVLTLLLGAALYPSFGLEVRPYLDRALPWGTGLFEIKEHLVALALPLSVLQHKLASPQQGGGRQAAAQQVGAGDGLRCSLSMAIFATLLLAFLAGSLLVSYRSL